MATIEIALSYLEKGLSILPRYRGANRIVLEQEMTSLM